MSARPKLWVVATPIGNLGDLSPRAGEALARADVVAAEDTRVTRRLLSRLGVRARLVSYREENERRLAPRLVEEMLAGSVVALVCDAGTPCISDPGYRLVRAAAEAGVEVGAVPGPSAVVTLLSIGGLPTDRFSFEGFPPPRAARRRALLEGLRRAGRTVVFYESPRRVVGFLRDVAEILGDPRVAVGRELTKLHEEVLRGTASEVASALAERGPRGEFAVAVDVSSGADRAGGADEAIEDARAEIGHLLDRGESARDVARALAPRGVTRREVYELARRRQGARKD